MQFNPNNWYWQVVGDTLVWASVSFSYVQPTDLGFQSFIQLGGTLTTVNTQDELNEIMVAQCLPTYLMSGLNVSSLSNNAINSFFALDSVTVDQVGTVARDSACGFGLPLEAAFFSYPDMSGNPVVFTALEIQQLYIAMRDYIASVNFAISGLVHKIEGAALPPNSVTISA